MVQNIYGAYEYTIQYEDEDSQIPGGAGALGTNRAGALVAIDSSPTGSASVKEPRHFHAGLGSRITIFHTFIKHEASLDLSGYIQNAIFISLFENPNYSYSIIVKSEHEKRNLFEQFLGSKPNTLKVTVNREEPVSFDAGFICREWRDNKTSFATTGLNNDVIANMDIGEAIRWTSDNIADIGKYLMVYGLDADGATYQYEITGPLVGAGTWVVGAELWDGGADDVFGCVLLNSAIWTDAVAAVGAVDVESATSHTAIFAMVATELSQGVYICDPTDPIDGINALDAIVNIVADAACVVQIMYHGHTIAEAEQLEDITMTGVVNLPSANAYRNMVYVVVGLIPNLTNITLDTYEVDPNVSWAAPIGTPLYTRRNTIVSRLVEVTSEVMGGVDPNWIIVNIPIADYDRDGTVDDSDDIVIMDNAGAGPLIAPATYTVVSSTGAVTNTGAAWTNPWVSFIYVDEINNLEEATFEMSNNQVPVWGQYTAANTSPELARKIEHTGLDVKVNYKIDSENLDEELEYLINLGVVTVASGSARTWGIEFKFGTSEAGTFKIWAMDGYYEDLDLDIAELSLSEEGINFIADDFDIF